MKRNLQTISHSSTKQNKNRIDTMATQHPSLAYDIDNAIAPSPTPTPTIPPTTSTRISNTESTNHILSETFSHSPTSPVPTSHLTPDDTIWIGDSQVSYSCGEYGNVDGADAAAGIQQLDFYFFYKVEIGLGGILDILDMSKLELSYVFNLASRLLSCANDDLDSKSTSLYTILEVDSAQPDSLIELGLCSGPDTTASNRLCHIIDGSLTILFDGSSTEETSVEALVSSLLVEVLSDESLLSGIQPNILRASVILPVTTSQHQTIDKAERTIFSTSTIASFCAGLIASILLLYLTSRRLQARGSGPDGRRGGFSVRGSSKRGLEYVDLDNDSGGMFAHGAADPELTPEQQVSFEPAVIPTIPTETVSRHESPMSPTPDTSLFYDRSASPRDSPCSDDSVSSVDLDCSIAGDLHTIYEEPVQVVGESISF